MYKALKHLLEVKLLPSSVFSFLTACKNSAKKIDLKLDVFLVLFCSSSCFVWFQTFFFSFSSHLFLSWQRLSVFYDKCAPLMCTITFVFYSVRKAFPFLFLLPMSSSFSLLFLSGRLCFYVLMLYLRFNFQSEINIVKRHLLQGSSYFWLTWSILHHNASLLTAQNAFFLNKLSRSWFSHFRYRFLPLLLTTDSFVHLRTKLKISFAAYSELNLAFLFHN